MEQKAVNFLALVLAAGKGTRMHSRTAKVLQPLAGKPLLAHLLTTLAQLSPARQAVIYGYQGEAVKAAIAPDFPALEWVEQTQQLGTGHAVLQGLPLIKDVPLTLILLGDAPLVSEGTLRQLLTAANDSGFALLTAHLENPYGYGRIIRDAEGYLARIVEEKDATPEEKALNEVNTGMMAVSSAWLAEWLPQLKNDNAQGEYYLTDLVSFAHQAGKKVAAVSAVDARETAGINTREQLAEAEAFYRENQAKWLMEAGATLIDPKRIDVHGEVSVGKDVVIEPNVFFKGKVVLGDGVRIESGSVLQDCTLADDVVVHPHCVIDSATIGAKAQIGPFARIRPQSQLDAESKVGNFCEIKASHIGAGSKVNHLSYIGDSRVGKRVNIGAGTITCNYDGANKWQTVLGDDVFIGSNSALVAPVEIDDGATIGAGSVITKNVEAGALAFTRAPVKLHPDWPRPKKK